MVLHLISAAPIEIEPLTEELLRLGVPYLYHPLGIGSLEAAKNGDAISKRIASHDFAIFIGTCGIFGTFNQPIIFTPKEVHWLPTCERHGISHRISGTEMPFLDLRPPKATFVPQAEDAIVLCSPNVSLSAQLSAQPQSTSHPLVENLELYSFLMNAQALMDRLWIFLASTNSVGQRAHKEWLCHHIKAHELLAHFIVTNIDNLRRNN